MHCIGTSLAPSLGLENGTATGASTCSLLNGIICPAEANRHADLCPTRDGRRNRLAAANRAEETLPPGAKCHTELLKTDKAVGLLPRLGGEGCAVNWPEVIFRPAALPIPGLEGSQARLPRRFEGAKHAILGLKRLNFLSVVQQASQCLAVADGCSVVSIQTESLSNSCSSCATVHRWKAPLDRRS